MPAIAHLPWLLHSWQLSGFSESGTEQRASISSFLHSFPKALRSSSNISKEPVSMQSVVSCVTCCSQDISRLCCNINAATPATWGADMDVPEYSAKSLTVPVTAEF